MRRKCDHIGKPDRRRVYACGDKSGDMGDVRHQISADRIGYFAEFPPINRPGIGGVACDDHLRLMRFSQGSNLFVIDMFRLFIDAIVHNVVQLPGPIYGGTVR